MLRSRLFINAALILLLGGLTLLVLFDTGRQPLEAPRLTPLDTHNIQQIRIKQRNNTVITLQLEQGNWKMTSPIKAIAHSDKVERLLKISQIKAQANYPLNPEKLANYGLENPIIELSFNDTVLLIGKTESVNQRRYLANKNQLYLLDDTFLHLLTNKPTAYIDTRLLPDNAQIIGLATAAFELTLRADNIWVDALNTRNIENKTLSSDDVQILLDEWRFARAISVQEISLNPGDTESEDIFLNLKDGTNLHFILRKTPTEAILSSPQRQLEYHISLNKLNLLLSLPDA